MKKFKTASVFAVKGYGLFGKISSKIFSPETDRFHFGLIGKYIPEFQDYSIAESININFFAKGVSHGWLSDYKGCDVEIYEFADPKIMTYGDYVYWNTLSYKKIAYDFSLYLLLPISLVYNWTKQLILEHRLRRIKAEELIYIRNKKFVCTEMANEAWWAFDNPIIPCNTTAIPSAFKQALLDKKIKLVYKGNLTDIDI